MDGRSICSCRYRRSGCPEAFPTTPPSGVQPDRGPIRNLPGRYPSTPLADDAGWCGFQGRLSLEAGHRDLGGCRKEELHDLLYRVRWPSRLGEQSVWAGEAAGAQSQQKMSGREHFVLDRFLKSPKALDLSTAKWGRHTASSKSRIDMIARDTPPQAASQPCTPADHKRRLAADALAAA